MKHLQKRSLKNIITHRSTKAAIDRSLKRLLLKSTGGELGDQPAVILQYALITAGLVIQMAPCDTEQSFHTSIHATYVTMALGKAP